jgi:hypothetical protein
VATQELGSEGIEDSNGTGWTRRWKREASERWRLVGRVSRISRGEQSGRRAGRRGEERSGEEAKAKAVKDGSMKGGIELKN